MGKFEKPLTWILLIGLLGYLFVENLSKTECSTEVKKEIRVEIQDEDENLNIDSMVDTVIIKYLSNDQELRYYEIESVDTNLEITE